MTDAIASLAALTGQDEAEIADAILRNVACNILPKRLSAHYLLQDIEIAQSAGYRDGSAMIKLANGRVFWGPREGQRESIYRALKDIIGVRVAAAAYGVAVETQIRYRRAFRYALPPGGGVIVEAGAKRGYQAVGFAERLGAHGRVLAVEMSADDYAYMRKTFEANQGVAQLTAIHAALSASDGEQAAYGGAVRTISTDLAEIGNTADDTVETITLKSLLDAHDIERVDYLNVMVNGAELDVLKGLGDRLRDVKTIRIACYYSNAEGDLASQCARYVTARGGECVSIRFPGSVVLKMPDCCAIR